ncbi:hypothetical protein DSOL_4993 [Desulfosporosinus metallidurans]|uniref:Uncharacterized protein n=1 Tax=Desulfosporosinus metallidurans TaxID=1888891 RepID=A0A1Q8QGH8_9FIRM|nr:hypothetical protein DSOL_4993 [Desulfosporosinus metallidurans]
MLKTSRLFGFCFQANCHEPVAVSRFVAFYFKFNLPVLRGGWRWKFGGKIKQN